MQPFVKQYQPDLFRLDVLHSCDTLAAARALEKKTIAQQKATSLTGFNVLRGESYPDPKFWAIKHARK